MQKQGGFQNGNTNNLHFIYCRRLYDQSSTGGNGKMKYTLYFKTHLTREIMQKADALNIGMIEEVLDNLASPVRAQLISKGIIYAVRYKELDFTVPEFDKYIQRLDEYQKWKESI